MTPKTPLQWLAAKRKTGPFPIGGTREEQTAWFRDRLHNLKTDIGASTFELRKCKDVDELYLALSDVKEEGSRALRTLEAVMRGRALKDFNGLRRFEAQYATLSSSVGHVFLLLAPDLASLAEKAT